MTAETLARIDADLARRVEAYLDSPVTAPTSRALITDLLVALIPEPLTDDEREAFADLLDEVHGECVTEGGCEFRGWQRGWRAGDRRKPSAHVDRILTAWRNRGRGPITDEEVSAAADGIRKRLHHASLHWGAEELHPDALPHIARAALGAARGAEAGR